VSEKLGFEAVYPPLGTQLGTQMKPVLLITYYWPPAAWVGIVRSTKLAKHLSRQCWRPIIVTVKEEYYEKKFINNSSVDIGPHEPLVIRTSRLRNPRDLYLFAKRSIFTLVGREKQFQESTLMGAAENGSKASTQSWMARAKRFVLSLLYTPDEDLGWLPFAVVQSVRAVKAYEVPCVISTGPPFTSHLVGLAVKKLCNIAWIADFRDPWRENEQRPWCLSSHLANQINQWLESKVVQNADRVVCVTPAMTEFYRQVYPRLPSEKLVTITNGFDAEEFRQLGDVPRDPKFTISYVGIFEYARTPDSLLRAVGDLIREGVIDGNRLAIRFIGKCRYAAGQSVEEMAAQQGLNGLVEIIDFLPRPEALKVMMRSHVLVLLADQQKLQVPGKAYEYMAAGGRILAVTEEKGATAELIRRVPGGAVVPPGDHEGIKRVLKAWYAEYARQCGDERNEAFSQRDIFNEYEWRELGARYAALLEECRLADTSQSDGWESYVVDDYSFAEFSPNALVLDVGSGDGSQLRELEGRGCLAVGIEPKCESVKSCRSQSLKVIRAVGEQIPLKTASCDGLICKSVLPYTEETCVLREIGRVLKPGSVGRLFYHGAGYYLRYLLCASSWKDRFYGMRALVNTWFYVATGRRLPSFLGDTTYQSRARLRRYYSECGLKLLEERPAPTFLRVPVFIYHSIQKTTD